MGDDKEDFWELLAGGGELAPAEEAGSDGSIDQADKHMVSGALSFDVRACNPILVANVSLKHAVRCIGRNYG